MRSLLAFALLTISPLIFSQSIGIGTTSPDPSAALDVSGNDKGILIPRLTSSQRDGITTPATGLLVFDIDSSAFAFFNGINWIFIKDTKNTKAAWLMEGNSDANSSSFIGTTNNQALRFKVNNTVAGEIGTNGNVALGQQTFINGGSGTNNTVVGFNAMRNNNGSLNTVMGKDALQNPGVTAAFNTALGSGAMMNTTSGSNNLAAGSESLLSNTTGAGNVAIGRFAMQNNTTGSTNIGIGFTALRGTGMTGSQNIGIGNNTMFNNTTGSNDIAIGVEALRNNTTGNTNVAIGFRALFRNTSKSNTVAVGDSALFQLGSLTGNATQGINNTAIGSKAMFSTSFGSNNTSLGHRALFTNPNGSSNTAIGHRALHTAIGNNNVAVGDSAAISGTTADNNTVIGSSAFKNNTSGSNNTAIGKNAGNGNTTGSRNTYVGTNARPSSNGLTNATAIGDSAVVSASNSLVLGNNAKVGIGTSSPIEKLDIVGNTKISGKLMVSDTAFIDDAANISGNIYTEGELKPNGQSGLTNQILTSNGNGTMQWQAASAFTGESGFGPWKNYCTDEIDEYFPVTLENNSILDFFGASTDISDNYAIIGAPFDEGSGTASIYKFDASGNTWQLQSLIMDTNGQSNDYFGYDVAICGDYVVVGVEEDDESTFTNNGSAQVYKRNTNTGTWEFHQKLINQMPANDDKFGHSVDIDGDYIIIGAYLDDESNINNTGSASIYKRNINTNVWEFQQKLINSNANPSDNFGYDVSISGNYIIVGAKEDDISINVNAGSASIFKRNTSTNVWEFQQMLSDNNINGSELFGNSVSIIDGYAVVGVPQDTENGVFGGAANIFKLNISSNVWEQYATLTNPSQSDNDKFGYSVDISDDFVIVGAHNDDEGSNFDNGSVTIFRRHGNFWREIQKFTHKDSANGDFFGLSVSIDNDSKRFVVGKPSNLFGGFPVGFAYFGKVK